MTSYDDGYWRFPILERLWVFGNGRLPRDPEYLWEFADDQAKASKTEGPNRLGYYRWLLERMEQGAYMPGGIGTTSFGIGTTSMNFSAVPEDSYGPDAIPNIAIQQSAFPSAILDPNETSAVTSSPNPSLLSSNASLSTVGGAAGATVIPNQTLYSSGSSEDVGALGEISSAAGQFGYALAAIFGSSTTPVAQAKSSGRASSSSSSINNSTMYILLAVVVLVIVAVVAIDE